jgi:hypothetical protein
MTGVSIHADSVDNPEKPFGDGASTDAEVVR